MAHSPRVARAFALVLAGASLPVLAQNAGAPNFDTGFFRPRPDGNFDVHAPATPSVGTPQAIAPTPMPRPAQSPAVATMQPQPTVAERVLVQQWTQEELERQAEHDRQLAAQQAHQAPTPITGAFTGLTSERDR